MLTEVSETQQVVSDSPGLLNERGSSPDPQAPTVFFCGTIMILTTESPYV